MGTDSNPNDILPRVSGVNPRFIERVKAQTTLASERCDGILQPAELRVVTTRTGIEGLLNDTRDPQVMDDTATLIKPYPRSIAARSQPSTGGTIGNSCQCEQPRQLRLCPRFEEHMEQGSQAADLPGLGGIAIYLQGTVGGLMTPLGLTIRRTMDEF